MLNIKIILEQKNILEDSLKKILDSGLSETRKIAGQFIDLFKLDETWNNRKEEIFWELNKHQSTMLRAFEKIKTLGDESLNTQLKRIKNVLSNLLES